MKGRPLRERLGFAAAGLAAGYRRERSLRTHFACAAAAFLALVVLRPGAVWWGLVAMACGLVVTLEVLNSAMEALVDLLHPGRHPEIKAIKDMVAGAVLLASLSALGVAAALAWQVAPGLWGRVLR